MALWLGNFNLLEEGVESSITFLLAALSVSCGWLFLGLGFGLEVGFWSLRFRSGRQFLIRRKTTDGGQLLAVLLGYLFFFGKTNYWIINKKRLTKCL
jgi:hypothetical protein